MRIARHLFIPLLSAVILSACSAQNPFAPGGRVSAGPTPAPTVVPLPTAALAGIIAGTILGYIFEYAQRFSQETPLIWAFDIRTAGLICLMVTLSAIFSAALATQPVIRQKAITILRDR